MLIDLRATMEGTWPPAQTQVIGPWLIREGQGGGQRVMATSVCGDWQSADVTVAEAAMRTLGQPLIFVLHAGDEALDAELAARGYQIVDPVVGYGAQIADLDISAPEAMTSFPHWPPMAIAAALWQDGGIGPERLAVMKRVAGPKTAILGRVNDRAAGVAFVAIHNRVAMLHALEVAPSLRRHGLGHNLLRAAVQWARQTGADRFSLVVAEAKGSARSLYVSLGLQVLGRYHYRRK